jgi:selenide, water dikinase
LPDDIRALLFDPQTSGGLLIAIDKDHAAALRSAMKQRGVGCFKIGSVTPKRSPLIRIE